ncbi:hypothetical protein CNY89_29445, partial [Amaricoccus sp. HAR-UPW-R2A-40]
AAVSAREALIDRPQFLITRIEIPDVSADLAEQIRETSLVTLPVNSAAVSAREALIDRPQFLITRIEIPDVSADLAEQ